MKNKRNLLFSALIAGCLTPYSTGAAAFSPQDTKVLTQIYAQIKQQVDLLKDELEEIKFVSDELYEARNYLQAVREEYEFATRFDPQGELNSILRWSDNLTNLNDIDDTSWQQKWHLLSGEIDKRFERSAMEPEEKEIGRNASYHDLNEIQKTRYLEDFYRDQALGNRNETTKDMQRRTASSASMMTSLMLEERAERLEERAAERSKLIRQVEWDGEFLRYLEGGH
ncbi:hypothetical protein Q672_10775 [Marinobacter sp. EVN1]|uniref:hypothetical protein n=1 Tax=Marinobacter sp. EVN1 TaxID=1397532 RepID=UPI0003B91D1C|nr:hypothetical protein [Marinobacter sp. EVN1]ERS88332.1 hypothetical protein Q672_10775 [Marinobacter sp. EVN1]